MSAKYIVENIVRVFIENGHRHYGENVTELEHALQTAEFARQAGEPDNLVLSCLLHDYGHLLHDLGEEIAEQGIDARHEELGAKLLAEFFPPEIVEPTRLHVDAKRYLCWRDSEYFDELSRASRLSLQIQGGPMNDEEAQAFEANPYYDQAVRVRRYDDLGKVEGMLTRDIDSYRELMIRFLVKQSA